MEKITFKKINADNVIDVIKLSKQLTKYQKRCVAPNAVSLAQAYAENKRAWPRAIYLGDQLIGFVMIALWDDEIPLQDRPSYYLWRFMIAKQYQHHGYGHQVLDLLVKKCLLNKIKTLYVSCGMEQDQPYKFYINYGFVDTGRNDGEQILKMDINYL